MMLKCRAFFDVTGTIASAAGDEEFQLFFGQLNVLCIGGLHDIIHVFAVSELFLLFIAQLGEDPFQ